MTENKKRILITGASGFVGHHFVEEVLKNTDWDIVALVRGKTVGVMRRLSDTKIAASEGDRVRVISVDLCDGINSTVDAEIGHIDYVCHLAANSHVDRSIRHMPEFYKDNVMGTVYLLWWAIHRNGYFDDQEKYHRYTDRPVIEKFLNFNTDEVFGPAPDHYDFKETDRFRPSNPYSGSKGGQWCAGYSSFVTYGLPVISTHMMNIFGERQNAEKLVPKTIKKLLAGEPMTIHCKIATGEAETTDPTHVSEIGMRHWLHARNAANATLYILQHAEPGSIYNIVGDDELDNLQLAQKIAGVLGKELKVVYQDFHRQRPGHDRRYALDGTALKQLGWKPPVGFDESLKKTVEWYMKPENAQWLK